MKLRDVLMAAASAVAFSFSAANAGGVAITFDDGWETTHSVALPMMKQYGVVGTFYVSTGLLGEEFYMDGSDLQDFLDAGWELGAHSIYHDDMTVLQPLSLRANLVEPKEAIRQLTGFEPTTFASPFGSFNELVLDEVHKQYKAHVNAWSEANGINRWSTLEPFDINRWTIRNTDDPNSVCDKIKGLKGDEVFAIVFHDVTALAPREFDITPETLETILKCIVDNNVTQFRIQDLVK